MSALDIGYNSVGQLQANIPKTRYLDSDMVLVGCSGLCVSSNVIADNLCSESRMDETRLRRTLERTHTIPHISALGTDFHFVTIVAPLLMWAVRERAIVFWFEIWHVHAQLWQDQWHCIL